MNDNKNKEQTKTLEQIDKEFEEDFWQTQVLGIPLKQYKVQRLSPCGRVKLQANGRRKIQLLYYLQDDDIV